MALKEARAVFLDKDGTLLENVPYNVDPERMRWAPGAKEAVARLHRHGFRLIVVSNQAGVSRGYFREEALEPVRKKLAGMFAAVGAALTDFLYCPHDPEGTVREYRQACLCRKPLPGMLLKAAADHGLILESSWMVGDILDDVEAGNRAGCRTILVDRGLETEWRSGLHRSPRYVVDRLDRAADCILLEERTHGRAWSGGVS